MLVYFAAINGQVKAGLSKNIPLRMKQLSRETGCVVELIGAIKGDFALERKIHSRLAPHRIKGEWYIDCAPTRSIIKDCLESFDLAEAKKPSGSRFGVAWKALFPSKSAEALAAYTGFSVRKASYEISGEHQPSVQSFAALLKIVTPNWK